MTLGELEQVVILTLARPGGQGHGAAIALGLGERPGRAVAAGTGERLDELAEETP